MKKIISSLLLMFVLVSPLHAFNPLEVCSGAVASGGETTYIHNVLLDDDAANTTVSNDGTGSDWTASENTSGLHSATSYGGAGSFYLDTNSQYFYSADNITTEVFETQFWWRFDNATAAANECMFQIGDGGTGPITNGFMMLRVSGSDELTFYGSTGVTRTNATSDFAPSADTWYKFKIELDADQAAWGLTVSYSANGADWTELTLDGWSGDCGAATFASPAYIGTTGNWEPDAYVEQVTIEDTTP